MKKLLWGLTFCGVILSSCSSNESSFTTESGINVEYIEKGSGRSPVHGEVITLNMTYSEEGGEVLFDTRSVGAPIPMIFDTANWKKGGMLYEVFSSLEIGDSIVFDIPANDLFEKTFRKPLPDSVKADSYITFNVGLVDAMSEEAYQSSRSSEQFEIDARIIDSYLSGNNIKAITTESGLRYVITEEGNGANAKPGANVTVHYNGTLIDGTKFDSSYDRGQPFSFVLGQGQVIPGWDEGIALLNKGAKATLFIPSPLGYGQRGSGRVIPPNSILKFDVELVDIN